jgi:hypothetical protein
MGWGIALCIYAVLQLLGTLGWTVRADDAVPLFVRWKIGLGVGGASSVLAYVVGDDRWTLRVAGVALLVGVVGIAVVSTFAP